MMWGGAFPEPLTFSLRARRVLAERADQFDVVHDNQGLGYGMLGVRRLGSPERVDADTKFDIASLSKSFNAAMIATLVDEKKLRWDDRVRDVLYCRRCQADGASRVSEAS